MTTTWARALAASASMLAIGASVITLSACGDSDDSDVVVYQYAAICVDKMTNVRLPDAYCSTSPTSSWYYLDYGKSAPSLNKKVEGGTFIAPRKNRTPAPVQMGGVPESGGVLVRPTIAARTTTRNPTTIAPAKTTRPSVPAPTTQAAPAVKTTTKR